MAEKTERPFVVEIQPKVLGPAESKEFMRLYAAYVERAGVPQTTRPTPNRSLSNCRDTETECTCDHDD